MWQAKWKITRRDNIVSTFLPHTPYSNSSQWRAQRTATTRSSSTRSSQAEDIDEEFPATVSAPARLSRAAKTVANVKKGNVEPSLFNSCAAPTGPKPKNTPSSDVPRKRAASSVQEPAKPKARNKDAKESPEAPTTRRESEDDLMEYAAPPKIAKPRTNCQEKIDRSEDESDTTPARKRDQSRAEFADAEEDTAESETEEEEDAAANDDDDDLAQMQDDSVALARVLELERPRLVAVANNAASDDEEEGRHFNPPRTASCASASSGHMSVPASDASSDSGSDEEMRAGLASLSKAYDLVPPPRRKPTAAITNRMSPPPLIPAPKTSKDKTRVRREREHAEVIIICSQLLIPTPMASKGKDPVRGRREVARDAERPVWKTPAPLPPKPRHSLGTSSSSSGTPRVQVKREDKAHALPPAPRRPGLKQESTINVDYDDQSSDDDVQIVEAPDISIVRIDGKVGLKSQHPRVEKTVILAIDYYLGYYLWINAFPSSEEKNKFARDAYLNAAVNLNHHDIKEKLLHEDEYVDSLAHLLHGRISTFRLKAKSAAEMTVITNYALTEQGNEDRVIFLVTGMRYLYPLSTGATDPKTGKPGADVVVKGRGYMSQGIRATLSNAFFKGSPSVASKYANLFKVNKDGRKEVPAAMVALGGTAIHAALNDHRSGQHVASKFEGNTLQEVYDTHIFLLGKMVEANSTVLADLYDSLVDGSRLGAVAGKPMAMEALAILGL
ncbi:hypothetical protein B0H17DRAFT_1134305 [Mycena rosella]|uniref:DUF6532 domain-containing protein n=1 Tax=Mycena rosella TaxID=1033263 RepID=A0AAD7DFI6_MYCRO|nr:hypothetical protein B0H17DRAFT_1134305 [Mycena rosella]